MCKVKSGDRMNVNFEKGGNVDWNRWLRMWEVSGCVNISGRGGKINVESQKWALNKRGIRKGQKWMFFYRGGAGKISWKKKKVVKNRKVRE